jgi:hypothetical protein
MLPWRTGRADSFLRRAPPRATEQFPYTPCSTEVGQWGYDVRDLYVGEAVPTPPR